MQTSPEFPGFVTFLATIGMITLVLLGVLIGMTVMFFLMG
jgi:hypothetical protein